MTHFQAACGELRQESEAKTVYFVNKTCFSFYTKVFCCCAFFCNLLTLFTMRFWGSLLFKCRQVTRLSSQVGKPAVAICRLLSSSVCTLIAVGSAEQSLSTKAFVTLSSPDLHWIQRKDYYSLLHWRCCRKTGNRKSFALESNRKFIMLSPQHASSVIY